MRAKSVALTAIFRDDGIFLQHRDAKEGIHSPDTYGLFGGHIELNDASVDAAMRRELKEETELELHLERMGTVIIDAIDLGGEPVRKTLHYYRTEATDLTSFPCHEGQGIIFIPFGSKLHDLKKPVNHTALRYLRLYLPDKFDFTT